MKNLFFVLCFLAGATSGRAQYQSLFGQDATFWVFEYYLYSIIPEALINSWQDTIQYEKDTLVQGIDYKKVFVDFTYPSKRLEGLIREDTTAGKVWFKYLRTISCNYNNTPWYTDTTERLILDFSLSIGDTFSLHNTLSFYEPGGILIREEEFLLVDSVYTKFGRKHIEFTFLDGSPATFAFIEGIGCTKGGCIYDYDDNEHMYFCVNVLEAQHLLCSYKDGVQIYANEVYDGNCLVHFPGGNGMSVSEMAPGGDFTLFPNPVSDKLQLRHTGQGGVFELRLTDMTGRQAAPLQTFFGGQTLQWEVADLAPGMYLLHLYDEKGGVQRLPVVKL